MQLWLSDQDNLGEKVWAFDLIPSLPGCSPRESLLFFFALHVVGKRSPLLRKVALPL
jgi:hypothetical protein